MLATRFFLLTTCLLIGTGVGQAQTPLTDPIVGQPLGPAVRVPVSGHAHAESWTPPTEVLVDDPLQVAETMEVEVETSMVCNCGEKKCPGVCRDPGRPRKPLLTKPGDRNQGDCPPYRYRMSDTKRAGNPHCVAPWATCSVNAKYSAWFVGGGAAFWRGRCRKPSEGTWGLDYGGFFGHANVWLKYTRGREQGGEGAYETDGEPEFVSRAHEFLGLGH